MSPPRKFVRALPVLALLALASCMDPVTEHRVRGNAHFREGDYQGAIAEYDEGLKARPNDAATLILKGNALYELGQLDGAYEAYAKGSVSDVTAADAVRGMALIATRKGDLRDAAKQFERLLTLPKHEHDSTTRVNLAKIYLAQGDLAAAEKQGEAAGHENGNDEAVLFTLGRVYLAEGKPAEARGTFQHLAETNPTKASGAYGLSMVAAKEGKKDEMLASLASAIKLGVPDPAAIAGEPAFAAFKDDPQFLAALPKK